MNRLNFESKFLFKQNLQQLLYLTDYTILTPLEIKLNTNTFQWYLKMPSVFDDHKKIIAEKVIEYQEMLRKRIEYFKRDLELYWEQVQEYVKWGDLKKLSKYKKKATILDKKWVCLLVCPLLSHELNLFRLKIKSLDAKDWRN